ncbi:MAG TPA: hypothetical protein PK644_00240 [bacterium]|nr:hypothetical protein [bacterium]
MNFEKKRMEIFRHRAQQGLKKIDPSTGLLRSQRLADKDSVHAEASGYNLWESSYLATAWAMTGREKLAWKVLNTILDYQDTNPESMTYGNFRAHSGWEMALDPNALSFMIPPLWYVYKHCRTVMPPALRKKMEKAFLLSAEAVNAHRGGHLYYTNIVLLNLAARLCLADALDLLRVRAIAAWEWEEWRNFILRTGFIPEYNAPGYTGVQIHALSIMLACQAPATLHQEVRNVMRHLIARAVLNYHEKIGMLTGARSRGWYITRGSSIMDTIFHFVLGTPEPSEGCYLWLGVPLSPDDLLPRVRTRTLPRENFSYSPAGYVNTNYLGQNFALGSVTSRLRIAHADTPVFLAYSSRKVNCGLAFIPEGNYASHFSVQKKTRLIAAAVWLVSNDQRCRIPASHRGRFTRLNTGLPHSLTPADFSPSYKILLGKTADVKVHAEGQRDHLLKPGEQMLSSAVLLETESVFAGIRFFAAGTDRPALKLYRDQAENLWLKVNSAGVGIKLNELETATCCGFCLEVAPTGKRKNPFSLIPELAGIRKGKDGWLVESIFSRRVKLCLKVGARQPVFYNVGQREFTPNLFYFSGF